MPTSQSNSILETWTHADQYFFFRTEPMDSINMNFPLFEELALVWAQPYVRRDETLSLHDQHCQEPG
jgi:hypothetical protein